MRHKLLCFGLLCVSNLSLHAQEVVATQGDHYSTVNGSVSFTVGEVIIETITDGSATLTQGFQQTYWNFVGLEDAAPELTIALFPNPGTDYFIIQTDDFEGISYVLTDASGKQIQLGQLGSSKEVVQAADLNPGAYHLQLVKSAKTIKTYQLIKTK